MYTIIDIETTGNGLKGNRITEISIFKFDGLRILEEFTSLVNPECEIPYFITGLTGIDAEMVAKAPTFGSIAQRILDITEDCVFVAHSVNFDFGVIREEFKRLQINFHRKKLCTVRLSRKLLPGFKSYSLGKLCNSLEIPLRDRHRARGDAHATLLLFQRLLKAKNGKAIIDQHLNQRSREATLPPLLPKEQVNGLPSQPGIYYFKNTKGEIIYIGKAIDIKKRVLGHFYDKSDHETTLCREIAAVDYELSGSELIALLMESDAIKKHYPKFNRAQKKTIKQFAIFTYEDRKGVMHLAISPLKTAPNPVRIFNTVSMARNALELICNTYSLCPKYCGLMPKANTCQPFVATKCEGICTNKEAIERYNTKVERAILATAPKKELQIIEKEGRHSKERGVVLIRNGTYYGFGFIAKDQQITCQEDLELFIQQKNNTVDTERILRGYL